MNLNEGYCTEKPQIKTQDNNIHLIKTYIIFIACSKHLILQFGISISNFRKKKGGKKTNMNMYVIFADFWKHRMIII